MESQNQDISLPASIGLVEERPWVKFFVEAFSDYEGYVNDLKTLSELLLAFEVATTSQFVMPQGPTCNYGKDFAPKATTKIRFVDLSGSIPFLEFDGIPFVLMGLNVKKCLHGPQKHLKSRSTKMEVENSGYSPAKKRKPISSVKLDCTAEIRIRHIVKLLDFKLLEQSKYKRNALSEKIHEHFKVGTEMKFEHRFLVKLATEHCNHESGEKAGASMNLDSELANYIHFNVRENPSYGPKEMQQRLENYLRCVMFKDSKELPPRSNTRFWPTVKTLRNHILFSKSRQREDSLDQQTLYTLVSQWREENPHDNFYLRLKSTNENPTPEVFHSSIHRNNTEFNNFLDAVTTGIPQLPKVLSTQRDKFLFVYQSSWQQELLSKYGNELCILEATYRTTKYSLPLFFIVVRTNINFIVVAMFIVEWESPILIGEALKIVRDWNTSWWPKNFLTDFNEEEIKTVKLTFDDCKPNIFLCDNHRLHCWQQWFSTSIYNLMKPERERVFELMKNVAESYTSEEYEYAMDILRNCVEWKGDKNLQDWFYKKWLKIRERWVKLFRKDMLLAVHTTNGEWQSEKWKQSHLRNMGSLAPDKDQSLSEMCHILIKNYLPDSFRNYCRENISHDSTMLDFCDQIPLFFLNRPREYIDHEMKRWPRAQRLKNTVYQIAHGVFSVASENNYTQKYRVDIISESGICHCDCIDWRHHHLPCKHILAVVAADHYPTWTYESLPIAFTTGPFFTLDLLSIAEMPEMNESVENSYHELANVPVQELSSSINIIESEIMEGPSTSEINEKATLLESIQSTLKTISDNSYLLNGSISDLEKLSKQANGLLESTQTLLLSSASIELSLLKATNAKKRRTINRRRSASKREKDFTGLIVPNGVLK